MEHLRMQLNHKDLTMQQALRLHAETLHAAELHVVSSTSQTICRHL